MPDFSQFEASYHAHKAQVLYRNFISDLLTPVSAFLRLAHDKKNCFLFESVQGGDQRGRYSIIGLNPDLIFKIKGQKSFINRQAAVDPQSFETFEAEPLEALRAVLSESAIDMPTHLPPMSAGVFGYLSYDMVRHIEYLPHMNEDILGVPDTLMIRPTLVAVFDAFKDQLTLVVPVRPQHNHTAKQAYEVARTMLDDAIKMLDAPLAPLEQASFGTSAHRPAPSQLGDGLQIRSNTSPQEYTSMVSKAQDYIAAGDIFQVVLSQRFEADFDLEPIDFYRSLRRINPSPFLYFLQFDDFAVVGSSPEILVRVADEHVTIRPLAGTRPRGKTQAQDKALGEELLNDPKELAEHLMLLDLGRNDVGRVCEIGSVRVTDQFFLEYYSHVMHIVSNVQGRIDTSKFDYLDALGAGFPAGTVSGAPKVRAMQIIDELEKHKRGPYAGCVGYFGADGTMDTCIVLRTAVIKNGTLYAQAGAGVVADSVPEHEQTECENKAQALFSAAQDAIMRSKEAKIDQ